MAKSTFVLYLEYIPIRIFLFFIHILPFGTTKLLGNILGKTAYYLIPNLRRIVLKNLIVAFGENYNQKTRKQLVKKIFVNFGITIFEFMYLPKFNRNKFDKIMKFKEGSIEVIEELYKRGHGIVCISCHLGNWEFLAAASSIRGYKIDVIVRPLDNILLDKYVENFRGIHGTSVIPRSESIKQGLKCLKNNELLVFMMDQNSAVNGVFVPFFNKLASTVQGPAVLCSKYKSPVMFAYTYRNPDNTHTIVYKEIPVNYDLPTKEDYIRENTAVFTKAIEEVIREHPEQWLWLHPRWRTRPDGTRE